MIITRIDGGLGNQMFQYAYGLYLARKHGSELVLDTSSYAARPQHGYLLDRFLVDAKFVDTSLLPRIPRRYRGGQTSTIPKSTIRQSIRSMLPGTSLRRHKESVFGFDAKHLAVPDNRYLVGYWQSERFFPGMRGELAEQFQLRNPLTKASRQVAGRIESTNSIAVHVRRGDYVTNASAAQIYAHLPMEYYLQAIQGWAETHENPEIFVFSNDIAWCRENFDLPWPVSFVDHNTADTAHEDLELMSRARCCVIANSTFSWWGAWLNHREDKTVIAPAEWFRPGTLNGAHILPVDWQVFQPTALRQAA